MIDALIDVKFLGWCGRKTLDVIFIPNRTFLVRFGGISGEFGRAMVRRDQTSLIFIPDRTFLVRFGGISGEFGRTMVRILARRSRAKNTHGETKRA